MGEECYSLLPDDNCGNGTIDSGEECGESGLPTCSAGETCNRCQCVSSDLPDIPTADIEANGSDVDITINEGDSATISWECIEGAVDLSSGSVIESGGPFASGISGSKSTGALSDSETYTLTCTDIDGLTGTESIDVNVFSESSEGDECRAALTKHPDSPTQTDIEWEVMGVSSCTATSNPLNALWNAMTADIDYDADSDSGWVYNLITPDGVNSIYALACNCDAGTIEQDNPSFPPGGGDPGTDIWYWVTHPGSPFIEEINPGTARFNIFEFFRNLVSGLAGKALAG
ncbi:MAG: hypothetical protein PHV43_02695 [Candidatus Colwellbacteria bacterium]|nr:hypothetical protein [Candidatus Colwellbacteria bacterium]